MSADHATNWTDPWSCPFCERELPSPGSGFVDHLEEYPECETTFEIWRDNVANDVTGEWSG